MKEQMNEPYIQNFAETSQYFTGKSLLLYFKSTEI